MKVLAIGDTHMDTSAICNIAIPQARKNDCSHIVQVGDFGYFENEHDGSRFLGKVSKQLGRNNLTLYWVDGNHENHPKLWADYAPGSDGLCLIRPNLYYVPRGTVFKLGHVKCLGLGGAFSIDKQSRLDEERIKHRPGTLWFPTEMVTTGDVATACENAERFGPVDVMFTHDAPSGVDVPGHHAAAKWTFPESAINRDLLQEAFSHIQPRLLVHGHHHVRYTGKLALPPKPPIEEGGLLDWGYCRVDGLANNGRPGFAIVLDLDGLFPVD